MRSERGDGMTAATDLVGQTLGGYRVAESIGKGAMAQVYKAYQPRLERWVAVKVLSPQLMVDPQFLARFRREARALSTLRHPNILTVFDYGEEAGLAYIVTEYVAGGSLKLRLSGAALSWPATAALLIPVCRALAYAHEQGVVHRDIKPANLLMPRDDWPLLADFGLVKLARTGLAGATAEPLTQLGDSLGTPDYMPPEQAMGEESDQRSDIYAIGVLLYELLTGSKPFSGPNALDVIMQHLQAEPVPPQARNPAVPEPVGALVVRALRKRPAERFQTMAELIAALQDAAERFPETAAGPAPAGTAHGTITTLSLPVRPPADQPALVLENGIALAVPPKGEVLIGRADPRNQQFPDVDLGPHGGGQLGVSRIHARLLVQGGRWHVEDLGSTNGTFVDDLRLEPRTPVVLAPGARLRCGHLTVTLRPGGPSGAG